MLSDYTVQDGPLGLPGHARTTHAHAPTCVHRPISASRRPLDGDRFCPRILGCLVHAFPPERTIREIATLITDDSLAIVAEGPVLAIHQPAHVLNAMDEWCRDHHGVSGLTARALASTLTLADAEVATLDFVRTYCPERTSPLCGNSIHQDRRFLVRYMPTFDAYLHYRNIDVSTVKELVRRWYPAGPAAPEKRHAHLALDDIRESIEELRFYRTHFFRS